ncbi:MAG: 5-formyltetrahydrofolate cyclo-ligase [Hyphomicrobiales bacterium]|nr:5-formyltetrahydrofolate cyclo-ligase [Hyphomicrobiales bacterium]
MNIQPTLSKSDLRAAARGRRDGLAAAERADRSAAIAENAHSVLPPRNHGCLAGFMPIGSECDPRPIMAEARATGAIIALPAFIDRKTMVFRRYDPDDDLVPAGFGTREPASNSPIVVPDVLLVPLLGFDRSGSRLGYGKGHYDRTIASMRAAGHDPVLVGVAFAVQEVDPIPSEPHDIRLHWLVTDSEVVDFRTEHV